MRGCRRRVGWGEGAGDGHWRSGESGRRCPGNDQSFQGG
jgi:hypothetical protein